MRITISNAAVEFDGQSVLTSCYFDIKDGEKLALVGRNGCGKTTLLRAIAGQVELEKGTGDDPFYISFSSRISIGYLAQVSFDDESRTMEEEILLSYHDVRSAENRLSEAQSRLDADSSQQAVERYSACAEEYERLGGYLYKKEYLTAVAKFGFTQQDLKKPLVHFSGGQRTKIALLRLLLSKPDVLLLDEPTNHLDISAIEWLEGYIKNYRNACVIVSHDRLFLDRTVSVVYEIEYGESKRYKGNYSAFLTQKRDNYLKERKDALTKKAEVERLMRIVEKFRYKKSKAAMAQAKLMQIKRIGSTELPRSFDKSSFHSSFSVSTRTSTVTLQVEKLVFGYFAPLGEISFELLRGQKLGIFGANGCGKSTLVKTIVGRIEQLSGIVSFGTNVEIGYFDQTMTQSASTLTVLEDFQNQFPHLSDTEARTALGAFLLTGEDVFKSICELSGGERVRYALCKILRRRPNVLVLDEPTNHMDIIGKETFEDMLKQYDGTVILVSHDRYLVNAVCDRLLIFNHGKIENFVGNYEQYEITKTEQETQTQSAYIEQPKQNSYLLQKERARAKRKLATTEEKITQKEETIKQLEERLFGQEGTVYETMLALQAQLEESKQELESLFLLWEQLRKETQEE